MFRVVRDQKATGIWFLQSNHRSLKTALKAAEKVNRLYQKQTFGYEFFVQEQVDGKWKFVKRIKPNNPVSKLFGLESFP